MLPERCGEQIDEERLDITQLTPMNSEHEIGVIGQSPQEVRINGERLAILGQERPRFRQCRLFRSGSQIPPVMIRLKNRERDIYTRVGQQLLSLSREGPSPRYETE